MKRCLDERELFALLDGALGPDRAAHARACAECSRRVRRLEALRAAAREATEPSPPDWDAVEARVLFAARAAGRGGRPAASLALRLGLSFAAAAAVAVVVAVSVRPHAPAGARAPAPPPAALPSAPPDGAGPGRAALEAVVADAAPGGSPSPGEAVPEGGAVASTPCGAILGAIGEDVAVEAFDGARYTIASLDEWRPTVALDPGAFRVTVTDGPLAPELVVLAAREELTFLRGTAEVFLVGEELLVRATGGALLAEIGGAVRELRPGESLRRGRDEALAVVAADWTFVAATKEPRGGGSGGRPEGRVHGTLPKSAVREALRSRADGIRACYEDALKRYPDLDELPVTARLRIAAGGAVARVRLEGADRWPGLGRCIGDVLERVRFPEPAGGEVEVVAPLLLTPVD